MKTRKLPHALLLIGCLGFAAAIQIPVAWGWAFLHKADSYAENTKHFDKPGSTTIPPEVLSITNNYYIGVRWITVAQYASGVTPHLATRSDFGEPYDSNPTYPLAADDVFAGLESAAAWPSLPVGTTSLGNIQFVQAEVQGLPWPCVYSRVISPPGSTRLTIEGAYWFRGQHMDRMAAKR